MKLITEGLELILGIYRKNKETHSDPFIVDSIEWVRGWLGKGENVDLMNELLDNPESPKVKEKLRDAITKRSINKVFVKELGRLINESKKSSPTIRNVLERFYQGDIHIDEIANKTIDEKGLHMPETKMGNIGDDFNLDEIITNDDQDSVIENKSSENIVQEDLGDEASGSSEPSLNKRGWRRLFTKKPKNQVAKLGGENDLIMSKVVKQDLINFSVFVSEKIKKNNPFILDIWAYLESDTSKVKQKAKELDRGKIIGTKEGVSIIKGSILQIKISIPTLEIQDPIDHISWNGLPTNVSFTINSNKDTIEGIHTGKAVISCEGLPVAKILFQLEFTNISEEKNVKVTSSNHIPKKAFASYASQNKKEVLYRIQGIKTALPYLDIFYDSLSLKSGDKWKEKLEENIVNRDIFYLFWSIPAAKSKWVKKEWKLALKTKGLDYISPIPLEDQSLCPPPKELRSLHFNDPYLPYIKYLEFKESKS